MTKTNKKTYYVFPYSIDEGFTSLKALNNALKGGDFCDGDNIYEVQVVRKLEVATDYKLKEVK